MNLLDTIAAISTPHGKGGVAMLRVSGADAVAVASRVFRPVGGKALADIPARHAAYGTILAPDESADGTPREVDDGIATVYRAPASFTGEDTVEICCHGGILLTQTVLTALLAAGARQATAGEFTRRAHLNGKLGLSAAESLGALLEAQNEEQLSLAHAGLHGRLESAVRAAYEKLRTVLSSVLACIDFPEEDLAEMSREDMQTALRACLDDLTALAATYRTGHAIAEGIPTVICGQTNVGKSSLYNRLVGHDAAIVTDVAGTTRDVLCETTSLGRVTLRLYDTAGLRETEDTVERIGIERARRALGEAELILALFDLSRPLSDDERALLRELSAKGCSDSIGDTGNSNSIGVGVGKATVIGVLNKADAPVPEAVSRAVEEAVRTALPHTVRLSTHAPDSVTILRDAIEPLFLDGTLSVRNDAIIADARQNAAILRAIDALRTGLGTLESGLPVDLCCVDLERAMSALGEIDGREVSEDVVSEIFSHFCVGK